MDQLAKTIHVKSYSTDSTSSRGNFWSVHSSDQSPTSVLPTTSVRRKYRRTSGCGQSLTLKELELKELKGFKDLGFEFSEEDRKDPNLVSIVPGLRKPPRKNKDAEIQRPYLSETWEVMEKNEAVLESTLVIIGRIGQISYNDQSEMKEQLKLWARSVASAIR